GAVQGSGGEAAETAARLLSRFPTLGLGTTCQSLPRPSVTGLSLTGFPVGETVSVPSGAGVNAAGSAGVVVEPLGWKSGVIGVAEQLACRQPSPKACWRLASSE